MERNKVNAYPLVGIGCNVRMDDWGLALMI